MSLFIKIKSFFKRKKWKTKAVPTQEIKKAKYKSKRITPPKKPVENTKPARQGHTYKPASSPNLETTANIKQKTVENRQPIHTPAHPIHIPKAKLPSQIKLVITGSVGAGKTTAIHAISEKAPVTTEARPTDEVKNLKHSTTTSMDYGSYTKAGTKVHVYGTPGQQRFSFMSDILTKGANGLIILINNNQEDPLQDLDHYLANNGIFLSKHPAAIGVTHIDVNNHHHISIYSDFMEKQGIYWPVIPLDARKSADIMDLIDLVIEAAFSPKFG